MLWGSRGGVREEKREFGVYVCAESFEGFDGVERCLERDLLAGDEVVQYCPIVSSGNVFGFRGELREVMGEAEAGREAAGEVGVEDPGVEFLDCVSGDRVAGYNVAPLGRDEISAELDFGGVGFVYCDKVGECAGLETW